MCVSNAARLAYNDKLVVITVDRRMGQLGKQLIYPA